MCFTTSNQNLCPWLTSAAAHDMTIDTTKSYFQCVKTSLKSVVKNTVVIEKLTDAALLAGRIMTHTLQFMKLYFIYCYDNGSASTKP